MAYPQTRVFNPTVLSSGTIPLPTETPYIPFDTSGVAGIVNADNVVYSLEITVEILVGGNPVTLECPTGWTSPDGFEMDSVLPGSATGTGAWRVLYDFPKKLITVLSASGSAFPPAGGGPTIPAPQTLVGPASFNASVIAGPIVQIDDTAGLITLTNFDLLTEDIAFTVSKVSTGTDGCLVKCPAGWSINGAANTDLLLPGSDAAALGAWLVYTNISNSEIAVRPAV